MNDYPDDWYDQGLQKLEDEMVAEGTPLHYVKKIYSFLYEAGIIDYDIEKEIIFERYYGEEE